MYKISFLLLFLFVNSAFAIAKKPTAVVGNVIDETYKPVEFAVVTLLKVKDSTLVKGMLTDINGSFSLEAMVPDNYLLTISLIGFEIQSFFCVLVLLALT